LSILSWDWIECNRRILKFKLRVSTSRNWDYLTTEFSRYLKLYLGQWNFERAYLSKNILKWWSLCAQWKTRELKMLLKSLTTFWSFHIQFWRSLQCTMVIVNESSVCKENKNRHTCLLLGLSSLNLPFWRWVF